MKLKKHGFFPNNKTKLSYLFFIIKSFFLLFLFLYSLNSLIKFIPVKNKTLFIIGLSLFLLLFITKILQAICLYQNVYVDLYEHRYTFIQKILIYAIYTVSLIILPLSFLFLVLQYNSIIDVKKHIKKLEILNKSIAIFFISSIGVFFIIEYIFLSLAKKLIEKTHYTSYADENKKIFSILNSEERNMAEKNKTSRDQKTKELKEKLMNEINQINHNNKNLKNSKYVKLKEKIQKIENSKGYYFTKIGTDVKSKKQYKIIKIFGAILNLIDLSLLSVNSIDFIKNNNIEFKRIEEKNEIPRIDLNSLCYLKNIYIENNK